MRRLDLGEGAYLELHEHWLPDPERVRAGLLAEVPWQERAIRVFGRTVLQPRLVAWLGDPDAVYTYSGVRHVPEPLTPEVAVLRARVSSALNLPFNGVLCNLYRDGRDAMGMHSDSEPELGPNPVVASLSLGAARKFVLRHKRGAARGSLDLMLPDNSLLVMRGTTQSVYRHGLPRVRTASRGSRAEEPPASTGPRVNLTFRVVHPPVAHPHHEAPR